ncbi:MAG TPA: hypothetical protein VMX12_11400 [Acidimicrobiia bacterium]|nr:hypothetical protein [Acidimicrobiia bacterium]
MDDKKFEKWGLLAGIEFVVLILVGGLIGGTPPKVTDSTAEITKYFTDHPDALKVANFLGGLSILAFLWFLGSLFQRLRAAEGAAAGSRGSRSPEVSPRRPRR